MKIGAGERCVAILNGHADSVSCLLKLNENHFVSGSKDKKIKIWEIPHITSPNESEKEGKCLDTLSGHGSHLTCLEKIKNNLIVSGSEDKTIKIWDISVQGEGKCLKSPVS